MTALDRFDRDIGAALAELAQPTTPDYIDDILRVTERTSQRPAWTFPERWLPMSAITRRLTFLPAPQLRPLTLLLVLGLLLAVALAAYIGSRSRVPAPFGLASNGSITFAQDGDLWQLDPVSKDARLVVSGPTVESVPAYSRDGTRLAFLRDEDTLVVMNADGSGLMELNEDPLRFIEEPFWSPDSRSIAVVHEDRGMSRISIVAADGGRPVETLDLGVSATLPGWRPPDGREILFRGVTGAGESNLYVVNADGTNVRSLNLASPGIDPTLEFHGASWSPDGSRILYGGLEFIGADGISRYRSHIVNADGTGNRLIDAPADLSDVWPVWSPDGRFIHFERVRGEYLSSGAEVWLAIAAADGSSLVQVDDVTDPSGLGAIWSPDGTTLIANIGGRVYHVDPLTGAATEQSSLSGADGFTWQRR